jgi:hypothetical protein
MSTEDPFIEKLRKIRLMSRDTSLTEEEAALWAQKLAELLAERGLSMSHLEEVDRADHVFDKKFIMKYSDPWRMHLFQSAELLYFCYSFTDHYYDEKSGDYKRCRTVVGRPHNVEILLETYEYLEATVLRLAREYSKSKYVERQIYWGETTERAARIGFERGCGERLGVRLRRLYAEQTAPKPEHSKNPNNLPALYKSEIELAKNFAENKYELKNKKSRSSDINDHGAAGIRAAEGVSLSAQLKDGTKKGNLLT